jgi:gamma-glutamylcyclotransferase (GGCT)/AIG2-like uncharacterized protein YtfP
MLSANYLFVYGTLLKDSEHEMSNFLASHASLISKGYVYGKLYQVSWFPGAVKSNNTSDKVYGSLFKINNFETVFKVLDDYEGTSKNHPQPHLFKRELVNTYLENDSTLKAWVYFYNLSIENLECIISGDFLNL